MEIGTKLRFLIPAAFVGLLAGAQGPPFACDRMALDPAARHRHFEVLGPELRAMHRQIRELPGGFEFEFPADLAAVQKIAEWAAGERLCCPFFDIDLRLPHDRGSLWLRLTGRSGVKEFIRADFDRWFPQ
ncbi:MAG TPA: hypothetical protein VGF59_35640 [Bryobacteraceae bacterium]|jgi:hypothetical protein